MAKFGADGRCLMRALQEELDDPDPQDCGRCAVCVGPRFAEPPDAELVRAANLHLRSKPLVLEVKKMAPDEDGSMRKLADEVRAEEGRALARLGDGGWDPVVRAGRPAGGLTMSSSTRPRRSCARWLGSTPSAAGSCAVPSDRSGALVPDFAQRLAATLGLPYADALTRTRRPAAATGDGQLGAAGGQRARGLRRHATRSRTALACSSTTCASAAGRSPCSPASCAATASRRSTRWRSLRRSERPGRGA